MVKANLTTEHWNSFRNETDPQILSEWADYFKGIIPGSLRAEDRGGKQHQLISSWSLSVIQMNAGNLARAAKTPAGKKLVPPGMDSMFNMYLAFFTHSSAHVIILQEAGELHKFDKHLEEYNWHVAYDRSQTLAICAKGKRSLGTMVEVLAEYSDPMVGSWLIAEVTFGKIPDDSSELMKYERPGNVSRIDRTSVRVMSLHLHNDTGKKPFSAGVFLDLALQHIVDLPRIS